MRNATNFVKNIHSAKFQKCPTFFLKNVKISPIFEKLGRKVAVKEVNFCIFGVVLFRTHFPSFSAKFSTQEISLNFKKISKIAKIGVRKTLFLEA